MSEKSKRFEDWQEVDCNDCARYWDSSCDGVQAFQKPCNSFLAARKIVIPAQMKALEKRVDKLRTCQILIDLVILAHLLDHILGG